MSRYRALNELGFVTFDKPVLVVEPSVLLQPVVVPIYFDHMTFK